MKNQYSGTFFLLVSHYSYQIAIEIMDRDRYVISSQQTGFDVHPTERVTSTQKPHFINACRYILGEFSCALDCFLEIWLRILSPLIPDTGELILVN